MRAANVSCLTRLVLGFALLASATAHAQNQRRGPVEPPPGFVAHRDLVYASVEGRDLLLDVYVPKTKPAKPMPVVVYVHGGGWRNGSKDRIARPLPILKHGYVLVSVGYRLSGEAIFPARDRRLQGGRALGAGRTPRNTASTRIGSAFGGRRPADTWWPC